MQCVMFLYENLSLREHRLLLWFTWILPSSVMLHSVGWLGTDASGLLIAPTFFDTGPLKMGLIGSLDTSVLNQPTLGNIQKDWRIKFLHTKHKIFSETGSVYAGTWEQEIMFHCCHVKTLQKVMHSVRNLNMWAVWMQDNRNPWLWWCAWPEFVPWRHFKENFIVVSVPLCVRFFWIEAKPSDVAGHSSCNQWHSLGLCAEPFPRKDGAHQHDPTSGEKCAVCYCFVWHLETLFHDCPRHLMPSPSWW